MATSLSSRLACPHRNRLRPPLFKQVTKVDGVMYVAGELSYGGPPTIRRRNEMRLSFGVESPNRIEDGISRLASAIRAML
jgi:2-aminoadipate transaminase